jgi:hypothetical protein
MNGYCSRAAGRAIKLWIWKKMDVRKRNTHYKEV